LRPQALSIPREALIRGPRRDRVVVALGDGRFTAREVMTGMESGDWVEILAGLAEGEKVVTSAQFLLDSEASLAGSIERLDTLPAADEAETPVTAFGSGWVESVDEAQRRIRISHGPIDALGWPGMTMEFEVVDQADADLAALRTGQDVRFQLQQVESGRFVIMAVGSRDADDQALTPELLEQLEQAPESTPAPEVKVHDHD
jgi:Cu(I)/Ag(I) efflux system membrane fusion protein